MTDPSNPAGGPPAGDVAPRAPQAEAATTTGASASDPTHAHLAGGSRRAVRNADGTFAPRVPGPPRESIRKAIRQALETDPAAARAILRDRLASAEANCRELDELIDRLGAVTTDRAPRLRRIVIQQAMWAARVEALLRLLADLPAPRPDPTEAVRRFEAQMR